MIQFEQKTKSYNHLKLSPVSFNNINREINYNSEEEKNRNIKQRIKNELFKKIKLKRIKIKENKNKNNSINKSSQELYEQKFNSCKNQFNQRYNELNEPLRNLLKKK